MTLACGKCGTVAWNIATAGKVNWTIMPPQEG
jgi:hypothetical protein